MYRDVPVSREGRMPVTTAVEELPGMTLQRVPVSQTPQSLPALPGGLRAGVARPFAAGMRQSSLQGYSSGVSCGPGPEATLLRRG